MGAEVAIAAATSAQVVVLAAAALYARRQVAEAKSLRAAQIRPFVVIDFSFEQTIIFLTVANIGSTIARNVRITPSPDLESTMDDAESRLADLKMFTEGIPSLAPGKTLSTVFDAFPARLSRGLPQAYDVTITYEGEPLGQMYKDETRLDLGVYLNLTRIERRGLHDIYKHVESLAKEAKKWTFPYGRGVMMRTDADLQRMQERIEDERRERREQSEE